MAVGTLEVVLLRAQGIKGDEILGLGKADPYALISCGSCTQRSSTAQDQGSKPIWNQTFIFNIEEQASELCIRLYNKNRLPDRKIGTARVPLEEVFSEGKQAATLYNVIRPLSRRVQGQVEITLLFIHKYKRAYGPIDMVNSSVTNKGVCPEALPSFMAVDQDTHRDCETSHYDSTSQMGYPTSTLGQVDAVMGYPVLTGYERQSVPLQPPPDQGLQFSPLERRKVEKPEKRKKKKCAHDPRMRGYEVATIVLDVVGNAAVQLVQAFILVAALSN